MEAWFSFLLLAACQDAAIVRRCIMGDCTLHIVVGRYHLDNTQ